MGESLFVYGTLRDDEVVRGVTGRTFPKVGGTLEDYGRREGPPEFPYFYAVPSPGASIEGVVITGLDPEALGRLDAYEGRCFTREGVRVKTAGGLREAWVYVGLPDEIERMRR